MPPSSCLVDVQPSERANRDRLYMCTCLRYYGRALLKDRIGGCTGISRGGCHSPGGPRRARISPKILEDWDVWAKYQAYMEAVFPWSTAVQGETQRENPSRGTPPTKESMQNIYDARDTRQESERERQRQSEIGKIMKNHEIAKMMKRSGKSKGSARQTRVKEERGGKSKGSAGQG